MKAIVYEKFGSPDVLELKEKEIPVPKEDEVLVKVRAASVNPADWHYVRGKPLFMRLMGAGLLKPKNSMLGADFAGKVEALGKNVSQFHAGDEVFGRGRGGFGEYVCLKETSLALKPSSATFEEAASIPVAALTALQGLRDKGDIQPGQKVLINGASGGVGTFAVQIAKSFEAVVTAVCSTRNVDMLRSLGADHVIDYTQEDFTKNGQQYDLILAVNGHHSIFEYKRSLTPKGNFVVVGGSMTQTFQTMLLGSLITKGGNKKMASMLTKMKQDDLVILKELIEAGKIAPVIDRRYPLEQTAEALRYLEEGHAQGKVIITVE